MKKLLFLIPLIILSCKKEAAINERASAEDSVKSETEIKRKIDSAAIIDSIITNSPHGKKVLKEGVMRDDKGNEIVRETHASVLPFNIGDEFTKENQALILKIKDFENSKISASVNPKNKEMNIRINQIKLPNGEYDGPFGKEIKNYSIHEKGEVWLIIGKSNMASGETKGSFTVSVE